MACRDISPKRHNLRGTFQTSELDQSYETYYITFRLHFIVERVPVIISENHGISLVHSFDTLLFIFWK